MSGPPQEFPPAPESEAALPMWMFWCGAVPLLLLTVVLLVVS